jgi:hypothetical protein
MTGPDQSRSSAQAPPTRVASSQAPGAVLGIRLWTGDAAGDADSTAWKQAPAAWLILDLITASEGTPGVARGRILTADFKGVQAAVSAARRLQWAIQGYSESAKLKGAGIAVLVFTSEESAKPPSDASLAPLEKAEPGQILLTEKCCLLLGEVPIFPLRASAVAGLRELPWRASGDKAGRSADEQKIAQLIKQLGLPDPGLEVSARNGGDRAASKGSGIAGKTDNSTLPLTGSGLPASFLTGKPRWMIGAAAVVALLIVLAGIFALSHKSADPGDTGQAGSSPNSQASKPSLGASNQPDQLAHLESKPDIPASQPSGPAAQPQNPKEKTGREKNKKATERAQKNSGKEAADQGDTDEPIVHPPPAPKPSRGNCELSEGEIPDEIDTAERSLAKGRYPDAERQFGAVLSCEPGNSRARAGLERVHRAVEARGER